MWNTFKTFIELYIRERTLHFLTSGLAYNILIRDQSLMPFALDFYTHVFDTCDECDNPLYVNFLTELFVKSDTNVCYVQFDARGRIHFLNVLRKLTLQMNGTKFVSPNLVTVLSEQFKRKSDCILKTVSDYVETIEPLEVTRLLENLTNLSAEESLALQNDKSLFITGSFLLKSMHMLGKESNNCFSILRLKDEKMDEAVEHPAYAFKTHLVRLLGNLCYKHKENQDEVSLHILYYFGFIAKSFCIFCLNTFWFRTLHGLNKFRAL